MGNIVAHAFPPPHGAMHFDDDELWGENAYEEDEETTDFFTVAVHEIGHALGLGHSSVKASIMYPYYKVQTSSLHSDDIMGMYDLYLKTPIPETSIESEEVYYGTEDPRTSATAYEPKSTIASEAGNETEDKIPDLCSTTYDSIAIIKQQIFIFKEKWLWIFQDQKSMLEGYPIPYTQFFRGFSSNLTSITAIYERRDGNVVVFSGRTYFVFSGKFMITSTGTLADYAIPSEVKEILTVFVSNYNNKTYLFEENRFWRFDERTWSMDPGYPKSMTAWREIPFPVTSVAVWKRDTFFFKGPRFWRFDNRRIIAHENYPLPTAQIWFGCPETPEMSLYFINP